MSGKKGMKKYPAGMREKVLTELREGSSQRALSLKYGISRWAIQSWNKESGMPKQRGRKPAKTLQEYKYENGTSFSKEIFEMVSVFVVMSRSSFDAKSAQHELVLSAGMNRNTFGQNQTNQDKPFASKTVLLGQRWAGIRSVEKPRSFAPTLSQFLTHFCELTHF